jgi:ArsR family transcriptional regulator, arsenate/arsenite/antimonite-responsive transcriptional repressor
MSKYEAFSAEQLADTFKALSNPNRLMIFQRLLTCCKPGTVCSSDSMNGFCVGELGEELEVAPSTLSHHIKELQRAGLIKTQRRGKNVDCFVETEKVSILKEFFAASEQKTKIE